MQYQQQQMYQQQQQQQGYEFAAQPLPQARYRDPEEYQEDSQYDEDYEEDQMDIELEELQDEMDDEGELIPDYYIDRPPTPEFKPLEKGKDISTQIEDWELYDFEIEVVPVLQLLVGKTIGQARMELIEESEDQQLKRHKAQYIRKRNAELMVTQRMENAFIRRKEETERRDQQHKLRNEQNVLTHQKMVSRKIAKFSLSKLKNNILDELEDQGFLKQQSRQNIKSNFLPWLIEEATNYFQAAVNYQQGIQETFNEYNQESQNNHNQYLQKEKERRQEVLRQREERRKLMEERKMKKQEYKRKQALKKQRDQILEDLEKNVILNSIRTEQILEGPITDIVNDERQAPKAAVFGGFLGQLWIAIGTLNQILDAEQQLSQVELEEFIVNFLNQNVKNPFNIQINNIYKEIIEGKLELMSKDLFEFEQQKEELINSLVEDTSIYTSFMTVNHIKSQGLVQLEELKSIMRVLLKIYFKSLEYKEEEQPQQQEGEKAENKPEEEEKQEENQENQEGEENKEEQQQQKQNEKSEEEIKQEEELRQKKEEFKNKIQNPDPREQDMVEAKKKINFVYHEGNPFEGYTSFLRIRIPFLSSEEIEREKQEQEELRKKQEDANLQNSNQSKNQVPNQEDGKEENQNNNDLSKSNKKSKYSRQSQRSKKNQEEEKQQEEEELTEEQKEAQKYAVYDEYVEIYDGNGYQQNLKEKLEKSRRRDIGQESAVLFNTNGKNCALLDERSAMYLRGQILHQLKENYPEKLENVIDSIFQEKANSTDFQIQEDFLEQINNKENIAVFDQEFQS